MIGNKTNSPQGGSHREPGTGGEDTEVVRVPAPRALLPRGKPDEWLRLDLEAFYFQCQFRMKQTEKGFTHQTQRAHLQRRCL